MISYIRGMYHFLWSFIGAAWYRFPSRRLLVIGVTGTKGKSTVISVLNHLFRRAGHTTAVLSSVTITIGDQILRNRTGNTMPGRMIIQRFLSQAVDHGCTVAFIEVTSQGITQHRHRFIDWDKAVFLDIHPEHIEAHGSFERYLAAKVSFFSYVAKHSNKPQFFIHDEDEHADAFVRAVGSCDIILFSSRDVSDRMIVPDSLQGQFNAINIAATMAIGRSEGIAHDVIEEAIASFPGLVGRMEIAQHEPFLAVIDYAHTPDSLRELYTFLQTKKSSTTNKLICVLGSAGGGRDIWKRPVMGEIAATLCDVVVLTDEDPYDESPDAIIAQLREGCDRVDRSDLKVISIIDRKEAIHYALSQAQQGDVVVATGKGSEESIHGPNKSVFPWSERDVFNSGLSRR